MARDHDLPVYSVSQVNRFLAEPALWLMGKVFNIKSQAGPAAWRGTAVETGADAILFTNASLDEATAKAHDRFDMEAQGEVRDDIDKAKAEIEPTLRNLHPALTGLGMPLTRQSRIGIFPDGLDIEIMGYVDYRWPDYLLDLKTTGRMPSIDPGTMRIKDKAEHIRQVAVYHKAEAVPPKLLYATPGKPEKGQATKPPLLYCPQSYELDEAWRQVEAACRAMCRLDRSLKAGTDPARILEMYPPREIESYLWDGPTRAKAVEVWKL